MALLLEKGVRKVAITGIQVSDIEAVRPGPSYTVDTLAELNVQLPEGELFLIVSESLTLGSSAVPAV